MSESVYISREPPNPPLPTAAPEEGWHQVGLGTLMGLLKHAPPTQDHPYRPWPLETWGAWLVSEAPPASMMLCPQKTSCPKRTPSPGTKSQASVPSLPSSVHLCPAALRSRASPSCSLSFPSPADLDFLKSNFCPSYCSQSQFLSFCPAAHDLPISLSLRQEKRQRPQV